MYNNEPLVDYKYLLSVIWELLVNKKIKKHKHRNKISSFLPGRWFLTLFSCVCVHSFMRTAVNWIRTEYTLSYISIYIRVCFDLKHCVTDTENNLHHNSEGKKTYMFEVYHVTKM